MNKHVILTDQGTKDQLALIDQAYCAADEIYANDTTPNGWDAVFKMVTRLGFQLDDLDAVQAMATKEEVA
jgi:hypothetical protein